MFVWYRSIHSIFNKVLTQSVTDMGRLLSDLGPIKIWKRFSQNKKIKKIIAKEQNRSSSHLQSAPSPTCHQSHFLALNLESGFYNLLKIWFSFSIWNLVFTTCWNFDFDFQLWICLFSTFFKFDFDFRFFYAFLKNYFWFSIWNWFLQLVETFHFHFGIWFLQLVENLIFIFNSESVFYSLLKISFLMFNLEFWLRFTINFYCNCWKIDF